jgi:hypothetical protein
MKVRNGCGRPVIQSGNRFGPVGAVIFSIPAPLPLISQGMQDINLIRRKRRIGSQAFERLRCRFRWRCRNRIDEHVDPISRVPCIGIPFPGIGWMRCVRKETTDKPRQEFHFRQRPSRYPLFVVGEVEVDRIARCQRTGRSRATSATRSAQRNACWRQPASDTRTGWRTKWQQTFRMSSRRPFRMKRRNKVRLPSDINWLATQC